MLESWLKFFVRCTLGWVNFFRLKCRLDFRLTMDHCSMFTKNICWSVWNITERLQVQIPSRQNSFFKNSKPSFKSENGSSKYSSETIWKFSNEKKIAPGGIRTQNLLFAPYNSNFEGAGSNPKQAIFFLSSKIQCIVSKYGFSKYWSKTIEKKIYDKSHCGIRTLNGRIQLIMPNLNQNQKMILVNIDQILTDYLMSNYAAQLCLQNPAHPTTYLSNGTL